MTAFNREEEALEEFVEKTDGTVVVVFSEPFHPGSEALASRIRGLAEQRGLHAVLTGPESHRAWAAHHGVFGTPALLVFRDGSLVQRLHGALPEQTLVEFAAEW